MNTNETVKICEKYCLNINEAVEYFGIGEKKLRQILNKNKEADFILYNGNKQLIKRKKFEAYIDDLYSM